jgi:PBP1b-binding outer membrane lipoprotein LpoB
MNIIKIARKPYLSMFLAIIFLFTSCEQYSSPVDNVENNFDYTTFNKFKDSNVFKTIIEKVNKNEFKSKSNSTIQTNRNILNVVNSELGSNLELPDSALQLSDKNADEMLNIAVENNWMSKIDVELTNEFNSKMQSEGFEVAIKNYETKVLSLTLTAEEFAVKNTFINTMKSMNYENPSIFKTGLASKSLQARSWWRCAIAVTCLTAAVASIAGCATGVGCTLAVVCVVGASLAVRDHC